MTAEVLTGEVVDPLTDEEFDDFDRYETEIERGFASTFIAGAALAEINARRLYRTRHATFEDYCERQWQMDRSRAYQLIAAAEVFDELSTVVDKGEGTEIGATPLPMNEGQARELTRFKGKPEIAAAVMRKASEDGPATAKKIKAAADELAPKPKKKEQKKREDPNEDPAMRLLREKQEARERAVADRQAKEAAERKAQEKEREAELARRAVEEFDDVRQRQLHSDTRDAIDVLLKISAIESADACPDSQQQARLLYLDQLTEWVDAHRYRLLNPGADLHLIGGTA